MERRPITLYAFAISPFVQKVAALLDYKRLPYRPVYIHPQRKAEISFSTRKLLPIIDDEGKIVEDSTDIALYLEEKYPSPATLPADPAARRAVLDLEDWIDSVFIPDFFVPNNLGRPTNRRKVMGLLARTAPLNAVERLALPLLSGFVLRKVLAQATPKVPDLPRVLDALEERLGNGPFLGSQQAVSLADLAGYACLSFIVDNQLDGAEEVLRRPALSSWMARVRPLTSDGRRLSPSAATA
jgi:glutathione S-transferase